MNYRLAMELKIAGFPQNTEMFALFLPEVTRVSNSGAHFTRKAHWKVLPMKNWKNFEKLDFETCAYPYLGEIINACNGEKGKRFRWLKNEKTQWHAQARPEHPIIRADYRTKGKTPEEAVANLYIEMSKN